MAKKRTRKAACPTDCGPHCFLAGVFGSVAAAIGLFLLVGGIMMQVEGASLWNSGLWYLGGFFLMLVGKHIIKKACPSCR
ncbi:hypothetical protein KY329_04030 [Candidatus Woesearchaeota archaeon]|nr:hypothetical protein [Candidatus Woesearchaeota archaeon]